MLEEIYIENLAVIEKATVEFTHDLNVFTGETGAGKSILIGGINALLGQRVTKDIVRTGAKKAVISGCFSGLNEQCLQKLEEIGIEPEDGKVFLTREIRSDGGSSARINSRSINISAMRELGSLLVTIHGQHDNQILMSPERHIEILDSYSGAETLLEAYREKFHRLQELSRVISRRKKEQAGKAERLSQLKEIIAELTELDAKPNEDIAVEEELNVSKNAVFLTQAAFTAERLINGDDDFDGADTMLSQALKELESGTEIMGEFAKLYERLSSVQIEAADIASELSELIDKLGADPGRFEWLSARSAELEKAKLKYGPTLNDVIETLDKARKEFDELNGSEESLADLLERQQELLKETSRAAAELSAFRRQAGERFSSQVAEELEFLNMPKVRIVAEIKQGKLTQNGMDSVEFLISANIGEEPRPIAKIASGGELSRIMLALKSVIADKDSIDTLIFDEIDTGVSGRAAQKIGLKLKAISKFRQVICVTHLSQMAVQASNHLLIEKKVIDDRTSTQIRTLDFEGRKLEIARMIGGDTVTELTLKNAEELLNEAANL